jgi:steroid 5-alpha reductase family enzyme
MIGIGLAVRGLLPVVGTAFGIQAACGAVAIPLQTEKFYDLSGSLTYITCIGVALASGRLGLGKSLISQLSSRQIIVASLTAVWATRLGSFLAYRIASHGKDSRFDKIKKNPKRFAVTWTLQAVWVTLTALPVFALLTTPAARLAPFGIFDAIGLGLWGTGFIFEVLADFQKLAWQQRIGHERRKTEFINEGVWTLSRHPNYFGEVALWVGNFLICSSAFRHLGVVSGLMTTGLFALSPLFVTGLLFKVSGIPKLEQSSDKKFGHLKEYQKYKSEVPEFFPRLSIKSKSE